MMQEKRNNYWCLLLNTLLDNSKIAFSNGCPNVIFLQQQFWELYRIWINILMSKLMYTRMLIIHDIIYMVVHTLNPFQLFRKFIATPFFIFYFVFVIGSCVVSWVLSWWFIIPKFYTHIFAYHVRIENLRICLAECLAILWFHET